MNRMQKDFKLKIEWTKYTGWNIKIFIVGYCIPVVEVNNHDTKQALEEVQSKLIEYLENESD